MSVELEIRRARLDDLPAILKLLDQDSFTAHAHDGAARAFEAIEADPANDLMVATRDGEVVGTLQLTFIPSLNFDGGWRAQVQAVRVRDDLRNLKIGTKMMEWVVARVRQRGCRVLQLTTDARRTDAHRFYQRLGFEASHVGMRLKLD